MRLLALCFALGALPRRGLGGSEHWRQATDFTSMVNQEYEGALCDEEALLAIDCDYHLWKKLLHLLCRDCSGSGGCVATPELDETARNVIVLYTTMLDDEVGNMELFSCRHGLMAALLFHSEHVALEFRRPHVYVDMLEPPEVLDFQVSLEEWQSSATVIEDKFRASGVVGALLHPQYLQVHDVTGEPVVLTEAGVSSVEASLANRPQHESFPLRVTYNTPLTDRQFLNLRRHMVLVNVKSREPEHIMLNLHLPVMSLSPFPLHTGKLQALRWITQEEQNSFVTDVSRILTGKGISHIVVDGDYTTRYWDLSSKMLDVEHYMETNLGLSSNATQGQVPQNDAGDLQRFSIFVPLEQRAKVRELLAQRPPSHGRVKTARGLESSIVEISAGHIQYGEKAYAVAQGLNFRTFCPLCLWVSIYFYVTESAEFLGSTGQRLTVLPLAFWVPCRIPESELFPVRHVPLGASGSAPVPRPPEQGIATARQRWASAVAEDPLYRLVQSRYATKDLSIRRRRIYYGSCRESIHRALIRQGGNSDETMAASPGFLPPLLPELLRMHDMSESQLMSMGCNLEMLMGIRQMHQAAGLEEYQDKIELTQEFRARGLPVPAMFYASYEPSFDVRPILASLESSGRAYVAKAAHMCCSKGVFVIEEGIDRLTNASYSHDDIQAHLQSTFATPFGVQEVDPKCGDWGTVQAGLSSPGVMVEEMFRPSFAIEALLASLGMQGGDWITPDIMACHMVWSSLFHCAREIKLRTPSGGVHTEALGVFFRDGSCFSCRMPMPLKDWSSTVRMLETMMPHADYVRVTLFIKDGYPVINEVEYTTGGLEVVPSQISREWTLQWLEGYYRNLS